MTSATSSSSTTAGYRLSIACPRTFYTALFGKSNGFPLTARLAPTTRASSSSASGLKRGPLPSGRLSLSLVYADDRSPVRPGWVSVASRHGVPVIQSVLALEHSDDADDNEYATEDSGDMDDPASAPGIDVELLQGVASTTVRVNDISRRRGFRIKAVFTPRGGGGGSRRTARRSAPARSRRTRCSCASRRATRRRS